jgi:hypothetical protein
MRLYISTLTKKFVQSASYQAPLTEFAFKRRDIEPVELYFLDEEGKITIPARFLGKALFVSGSHPEFNGKYFPTGSTENGKPVWAMGDTQIKRVAAYSYASYASLTVANAPLAALNGRYFPAGSLNNYSRYKHENSQNYLERRLAETILGDGVILSGPGMFSGLYLPDGTLNGKPRFRKQGVARISWKPQWQSISDEELSVSNLQVYGVYFDGTYKRAPTPYNGRPRYYRFPPSSPTSILSSIQFESASSIETEEALGNSERINLLTGTGGHFSVSLNGRFVKSTGNTIAGIGTGLDKWTLGNNEAYIVSRPAGTYTNPYRLNLPNIGYTTSGSYLGGNNWFLDDTPHNGQPQWYFGSSQSNPICFLRYDDPTNRKWRFIQTLSGTNTAIAELTVPEESKSPIGKSEGSILTLSGAGLDKVNGPYIRSGTYNEKSKFLGIGTATGCSIFYSGIAWIVSTSTDPQLGNEVRYLTYTTTLDSPHLVTGWSYAGTPGTVGPVPAVTSSTGWVKLNTSSFDPTALNAAGGLKNDSWIVSEDHWLLATAKAQSSGLDIDSLGQNPLAWSLKSSTIFPANYAGDGDTLAWRCYADGSYGWETTMITDEIPERWVARQVGTWPPSPPPVDGLCGWGGKIEFYTEDTKTNLWETTGWRRSASQPLGTAIQRKTLTYPSRWLLHDENNIDDAIFQAVVPADVPYGPWLDGNGDSFDDMWTAIPGGRASGNSELSSQRESRTFPNRWSLGNNAAYSETASAPWGALNWKTTEGSASAVTVAPEQATVPAHWSLITQDGEEQYAAFDSPESPVGANWEVYANDTPPQSVIEVDHYAPLNGKLAIKKNLLFDGPILAESSPWTENPETKSYSLTFNLNSAEIDDAFDKEQEFIDGMIELTWSSAGAVTSSFTLPVKIYNDVIRGHEGPPSPPRSSLLAEMSGLAIALGG